MTKEKRTWYYLLQPAEYSVICNEGGKLNKDHKITWSEFAREIWCYDCKKDMRGFGGIFDGPISMEVAKMTLGKRCFYRYHLVKNVIEAPVHRGNRIFWRKCPALSKRLLK